MKSLERKDEPFARFLIRFGPIGNRNNLSVSCSTLVSSDTLQAEGIMPLVETITTSSPTTGSHKESLIRRRDESDLCNENKLSTTVFPNLSQRSKSPEASKPAGANLATLDLPASLSDIKVPIMSLECLAFPNFFPTDEDAVFTRGAFPCSGAA